MDLINKILFLKTITLCRVIYWSDTLSYLLQKSYKNNNTEVKQVFFVYVSTI